MFSFNEEFRTLWAKIPTIVTFQDYVELANTIGSARLDRQISDIDEKALEEALEIFRIARGIKLEEH